MIDLTPLDVRKKRGDFAKQLRGYDAHEVDGFLELVAERLEALVKENLTLKERTARLTDQLRSQEGRERAVQEALVTAQELREDILGQARREADLLQRESRADAEEARRRIEAQAQQLKRDAQAHVERALEHGRTRAEDLLASIEELERRRVRFLKSFRGLLERELDDVEVEEMKAPTEEEALEINLTGFKWQEASGPPAAATGAAAGLEVDDAEPAEPAVPVDIETLAPTSDEARRAEPSGGPDDVDRAAAHQGEPLEDAQASRETADDSGPGPEPATDPRVWTSTLVYDERTGNADGEDPPFRGE
jgi:DivIVA domain-containing protein